jgi:UDPglucose 6-dehydrogenase
VGDTAMTVDRSAPVISVALINEPKGRRALSRIFIVGSGVVGTATGLGLAHRGHKVTFIDVLPSRVEALRADGLDATDQLDLAGEEASFIFLTLPTPHVVKPSAMPGGEAERRYDLAAFRQGVRDVGRALRTTDEIHTIVVRSTVPPGTTVQSVLPLLEETSGKREGRGFTLASNPEFLRAVSAVEDFRHPWMTVVGARNKRTGERLADLLRPFGGELRVFDDPTTTETIKIVHNVFNAVKISFWNEMWGLSKALKVDPESVSSTVALSAEGSWNTAYGIVGGAPYGGACLPKDTNGLLGLAASIGVDLPLLKAAITVNEGMLALVEHGRADSAIDLTDPARVPASPGLAGRQA